MKQKTNINKKIMKVLIDKINKSTPEELQDALDYLNTHLREQKDKPFTTGEAKKIKRENISITNSNTDGKTILLPSDNTHANEQEEQLAKQNNPVLYKQDKISSASSSCSFNLSDKIKSLADWGEWIKKEDVKEVVRILKEVIDSQKETDLDYSIWLESQVNKIFGDKLNEN